MSSNGALSFNNHFLNQIIFHCIQNTEFLKKVRPVVPLSIFKTRDKELLIKDIFDFYDEYGTAPKDNFYDIFKEREKTITSNLYERCINLISVLKDITGSNPDYILSKLNEGIRHYQLEEASVEFASLIKRGKYDDAQAAILKALKNPNVEKPYYNFFKDKTFIEDRLKDEEWKMVTRIKELDKVIGGYQTGWMITILGATKAGKTHYLCDTAVSGVFQGLNVLLISLEMNKKLIDARLDQTIGFMSNSKVRKKVDVVQKVGKDYKIIKKEVDTIYEVDKVIKNRQRFKKISGKGNLEIVAFNRGRLNGNDIERIIDELEETKGYYVDLLVVDYLGIMKPYYEGQPKKERISENCLQLKEIAGNKNLIAVSAMQGNRSAMKAKTFHSHLVADDIDTIFHSDLVLALCQTEDEEKENKARIYVANYRHGKQHTQVGIVKNLDIGQIAIDSFEIKDAPKEQNTEQIAGLDY